MIHPLKFKPLLSLIAYLLLLIVLQGCYNYYKTTNVSVKPADKSIDSLQTLNRYFVLRAGGEAFFMHRIELSPDRKTLHCTLDTLPPVHTLHLNNGYKGDRRYRKTDKKDERPVLNEVHLYIQRDSFPSPGSYTLSLDKIQKIEVIQKDGARTTESYIIGTLGYTLGGIAVAAIIIAATKSSCPFVSAYDGKEFALQGEIFGGAIYPQLVRHDYLPLKMSPSLHGNLQVKISNELKERQFTDMAELLVVKHQPNISIAPDPEGNLYSIEKPEEPFTAILCGHKDVKDLIRSKDDRLLYFDDSTATDGNNCVNLQFKNHPEVNTGKLVLKLKNSYWLDYLYGDLAKGFGSYYNTYVKTQFKKPASELTKWSKDQQIPLEISLKTGNEWRKVYDLKTVGPLATRELVIPIDLSSSKNPVVEIRLSSGYLFWEIDYAAMDFTPDEKLDIQIIQPYSAVDETGKDVLSLVAKEDNKYLEQPVPGTVATLEYKWSPVESANALYTYILHTKGYYLHVRSFSGSPDKKFLTQFKQPGAFSKFSLRRFKEFNKEQLETFAKK